MFVHPRIWIFWTIVGLAIMGVWVLATPKSPSTTAAAVAAPTVAAPRSTNPPTSVPAAVAAAAATATPQPAHPTSTPAPAKPTATPVPARPTATTVVLPGLGDTASKGNWAIAYSDIKTYTTLGKSQFSKGTDAQGLFVVLTLGAKNLHDETSTLNSWDFTLKAADKGTKYQTSSDGTTAWLFGGKEPKPLTFSEQVQPGLTKQFVLVFDVNPNVSEYVLTAAGIDFQVELPD